MELIDSKISTYNNIIIARNNSECIRIYNHAVPMPMAMTGVAAYCIAIAIALPLAIRAIRPTTNTSMPTS